MSYQPSAPLGSIVIQEAEDELIVYNSRSQRAHCLNSTAASVLRLCDGSRTASEIASQLPREHDLPVDEAVVWLALDGLFKAGLLMEPVPARKTRYFPARRRFRRYEGGNRSAGHLFDFWCQLRHRPALNPHFSQCARRP